jgi:LPXTG-site transpeptidase (sortase) family protein
MVLRKENNKVNLIRYIGLFLLVCGTFMLIYNHCMKIRLNEENDLKIEEFLENENTDEEIENTDKNTNTETTTSNVSNYNYIAVLEIPSINLKRGLVDPSSKYNNVNYNIQIIDKSTMPDVVNGNLVLASHNGASYISFFKNLYKLNINDKIYIYYGGYKYEYLLSKIYDTQKDGNIEVYRDNSKTTITLITCKKNTKDTQVVYVGYLESKELY